MDKIYLHLRTHSDVVAVILRFGVLLNWSTLKKGKTAGENIVNTTIILVPSGTNLLLVLGWVSSWDQERLQDTWTVLAAPERGDLALEALPFKTAVGRQDQLEGKHPTTVRSLCRNARHRAFVLVAMAESVKRRKKVLGITTMSILEILHVNNWLNGKEGPSCLNLDSSQELVAGECLLKLVLSPDGKVVDDQWIDLLVS